MKNKNVLLLSLVMLLSGSSLMAQTGQNWKTVGNSLNAAGKLGTTNLQDVNFISNNVVNGTLNKNGRWGFGIGTSLPAARLHINSASGEDAFRVQVNNSTKLLVTSTGGVSIGTLSNGPINGLTVSGSTGIGTSSPSSKLHVQLGNSGITPFFQSVITAENSSNAYINILAPSANETGILFGTSVNNVAGGIIYNSSFFGTKPNALQFRTNGNIPRMVLTSEGKLALGPTLDPSIYRMKIDHAGNGGFGFDLANSGNNTDWEFFAGKSGLSLFVDGGAGGAKGIFNRTTGAYSALSDERSKTNIKPMANVLEKISRLKASSYQFKNTSDKQEYDGFIAQEVMKVFPGLVTHNVESERKVDQYLLNYSGFGVIAIKGIQELMKQNEDKDAKIDALQKQIDELKAIVLKGNANSNTSVAEAKINTSLTDATLEQNAPNPFANTTSIRYSLPQKFTNAQIVITDNNGKTIKQVKISGANKGVVHIDASLLSAGNYSYALIVDGKIISSKQMAVAK